MKRHELTNVRIERMALCASPAQAGATIVVAKRRPDDVAKVAPKPDESEKDYVSRAMGDASMVKEFPDEKQRVAALHSMYRSKTAKSEGDDSMLTEAELKAAKDAEAAAKADAAAAKARGDKIAALSTEEHAAFKSLPAEKQDAFLALDSGARANEIAKAKDSNPVVFTAKSGETFRRSDDPRLIALAKRADEQAEALAKSKAEQDELVLKSRAKERFTKTSFTLDERAALLRMLDGGTCPDEALRKSIATKLDAIDASLAKAFERAGVSGEGAGHSEPVEKFNALVKAHMETAKVGREAATLAVAKSAEGRPLWRQIQSEKSAA